MKNKTVRILVTALGGWFGLHKFLDKKFGAGLLYLCTGGIFTIGWIIDVIRECKNKSIYQTVQGGTNIGNGLMEKETIVAGTQYHKNEIVSVMKRNPRFDLSDAEILKNGKDIYEYFILRKNAMLVPEPGNLYDVNAVKIIVDGELIGYIPSDESTYVSNLIRNKKYAFSEVEILGGRVKRIYSSTDVVIEDNNFRAKVRYAYR